MPEVKLKKAIQKSGSQNALHPDLDDVTAIVTFLENFQKMVDPRAQAPSKLISMKVSIPLLEAFRFKCEQEKIPYQTKIKQLMEQWLKNE